MLDAEPHVIQDISLAFGTERRLELILMNEFLSLNHVVSTLEPYIYCEIISALLLVGREHTLEVALQAGHLWRLVIDFRRRDHVRTTLTQGMR